MFFFFPDIPIYWKLFLNNPKFLGPTQDTMNLFSF